MKYYLSKTDISLLKELIRTDFKLRYQGSVLGYVWSLLKPLMLFGILFIVFTKFLNLGKGIPNYPQSLLLGIVLWTFFVEATSGCLKSIVGRGSLIRKINIPRYLIPFSTVASASINLGLNLIVVFVFILLSGESAISWATIVFFPVLLIELIVLTTGVGLFLSAAYVKFRDIDNIWDITRQALFYAIPIIYPLSRIPSEEIRKLIILNPIAQIIQDSRIVITSSETLGIRDIYGSIVYALIPLSLVVLSFLIGVFFFRSQSKQFAENV